MAVHTCRPDPSLFPSLRGNMTVIRQYFNTTGRVCVCECEHMSLSVCDSRLRERGGPGSKM